MARTHNQPEDASRPSPTPPTAADPESGWAADAVGLDADAAIGEADAALGAAGAALEREADAARREATSAMGPTEEPGSTAAIGRAAVDPSMLASPTDVVYEEPSPFEPSPFETSSLGIAPFNPPPFHAPPFGTAPQPPPVDSYEELLGGLGERPFDSPRPVTPEAAWGRYLRQFGRAAVWAVPVSAVLFALSGMWGWPTRTAEPAGESPGTWLVATVFGLIFGLLGVLALTALLSSTPGRRWSVGALALVLIGSLLLAPVLGVVALARPSVTRAAGRLGPDLAAELDLRFLDNAISRWLGVGGMILLAVGWFAFGIAVLASGVLNRVDGYLVLCAVAIAVLAAYLSWQFLITVAAMVLLAAGLGLAWSASRLHPDGRAVSS